jgi:hypothetical protein
VKTSAVVGSKRGTRQPVLLAWQPLSERYARWPPALSREEWLTRLLDAVRPVFESIGLPIPARVRVTCGWPSRAGLGRVRQRVGECWPASASADQTVEIFISPYLDDETLVVAALMHELIHAGGIVGHRGSFPRIAKAIGLLKPWRATSPTEVLRERLNALILESRVGPYPHAQLGKANPLAKKDGTRMQKLVCPEHGFTVRTSQKWIDFGLPRCPCGLQLVRSDRSRSSWRPDKTGLYE